MDEVLSTKRFFDSHNIALSNYWLESCIQWFREENPNLSYTMDTLHLKVYEQWLLLDLRDVDVPILPNNLTEQKKMVLNGTYSLQMICVVDISRPKLWQIQKLRNNNVSVQATNDQERDLNSCAKRMLQLRLTDGVQEVEAIEYKPIKALHLNLAPGIKIRITGPVTIRRGQMMLEEKHVSILGGEVEELLVTNATENILAHSLNLPLNRNPKIIEESFATANTDILQPAANLQTVQNQTNIPLAQNRRNNQNMHPTPRRNTNIPKQQKVTLDSFTEDDELRIMAEVDMLLEIENDFIQEQKHKKPEKPNIFENHDMDTDDILEMEDRPTAATNKHIVKSGGSEINNSMFEDMDIDQHLDIIDEQIKLKENSQTSVITLSNLLANRNNIKDGKFTVQAKFKRVIKKLGVSDQAWFLKVLITDDSADMEVFIHSDVITDLMGYSPSAMMLLKKDVVSKDEDATNTVLKAIDDLKTKIMHLDGMVEIAFTSDESCPTIMKIK